MTLPESTAPHIQDLHSLSLGREELALCLALINRPDLGQNLLAATNGERGEAAQRAALEAAGHALLARGFCRLNADRSLTLLDEFQGIFLPLARFDEIIQVSRVQAGKAGEWLVSVLHGRAFTAQHTADGLAYRLDSGPCTGLVEYLEAVLDLQDFSVTPSTLEGRENLQVSLSALGGAQELAGQLDQARQALEAGGLPGGQASLLADDLARQTLRGSLARIRAGSSAVEAGLAQAPRSALLLLKAPERSWLFEFPQVGAGDCPGVARLAAKGSLERALKRFTNGEPLKTDC
jgi:hypothetical protein